MNVLFLCSRNRLRSPTAERLFADWPGVETASAGLSADAESPVTPERLGWADLIVVMEAVHRRRLYARFAPQLRGKRIVCLDIRDDYDFMDPRLMDLLNARMPRHLRQAVGESRRTRWQE
jgi:predicted protein tyrosine phosphatase